MMACLLPYKLTLECLYSKCNNTGIVCKHRLDSTFTSVYFRNTLNISIKHLLVTAYETVIVMTMV